MDKIKSKGMTAYLFNGLWTNDKKERKYRHMSAIPFPVCEYATIHYEERRQIDNWIIESEDDYKIK